MAMQQAGLTIPEEYIRYGDWEYASGNEQASILLALKKRPTAIFAMNDLMAAGCMDAISERGFTIPGDIAVVGFDNRDIARYLHPALTTIALPTTEIGNHAALRIIERITNPSAPPTRDIIPCSIVERSSA